MFSWFLKEVISDCNSFNMLQVLFPNESVPIILARMIGTIGPIDMEMLALGQETQKYFTDEYDLFHKNEETGQLEYLIPEKSSLRRHLQYTDKKFVDFLSYLLQINPRKRPTAIEALQHRWLSVVYSWACQSSSFLTNRDSVWSRSFFLTSRISFWSYLARETTRLLLEQDLALWDFFPGQSLAVK